MPTSRFWSLLLPRFDLIGYDLRNHGRNPLGDLAAHHMPMMVWDNLRVVRAIDRYFGPKPKIGVYHSVSAAIAVFQAIEESSFTALVLFESAGVPSGTPRRTSGEHPGNGTAHGSTREGPAESLRALGRPCRKPSARQVIGTGRRRRCRSGRARHATKQNRGGRSRAMLSARLRKQTSSSSSTNGQSRSTLRRLTVRSR